MTKEEEILQEFVIYVPCEYSETIKMEQYNKFLNEKILETSVMKQISETYSECWLDKYEISTILNKLTNYFLFYPQKIPSEDLKTTIAIYKKLTTAITKYDPNLLQIIYRKTNITKLLEEENKKKDESSLK